MVTITVVGRVSPPQKIQASPGQSLREALLAAALSPYVGKFSTLNCQGLGVCGTCKVQVHENGEWWERRSCQIRCFHDLEIHLK